MAATEVKVPNIGDFKDIPVIQLLVKAGDKVQKDDSLLVLESDKATLEVPAPAAGVISELKVKIGDKVSAGTLVALLEGSNGAAPRGDQRQRESQSGYAGAAPAAAPASPRLRPPSSRPRRPRLRRPSPPRRRSRRRHRPCEPRRAPVRARAGSAARSGDRLRPEEPDPQGGHPLLRQADARPAARARAAAAGSPIWGSLPGPRSTSPSSDRSKRSPARASRRSRRRGWRATG